MKKFGLLGENLGHSYSPSIHAMLGEYSYELFEVAPDGLHDFMTNNDLNGFNVTIPYKQKVMPYCGELSERAKSIGSVNTVLKRSDGSYFGENTDYDGFLLLMEAVKERIRGKKALVLGSGGASKTVEFVLRELGAEPSLTVSRRGILSYNDLVDHSDAAFIINTTPVGMYPNNGRLPLDLNNFPKCLFVADLIYNPLKTALMLQAERLGIPYQGGLLMLTEQARRASELFTGSSIVPEASYIIAEEIQKKTKNIILIGMPGCGKTSIGRYLHDLTKRKLVDLDEEIERKEGRSIPEILADFGEDFFRKIESSILSEVCKESGLIVTTGGGVVTRAENKDIIRQNSIVIFIKRELNQLASEGRPLTQAKGVGQIYRERADLYSSWSDISVENVGFSETTEKIMEVLKL